MPADRELLDLVADCLLYPGPGTAARARAAAERAASEHPELTAALFSLAVWLERGEPGEAEERYSALFDLNPVCTLNAGYHLFGDTYVRGELLAGLAGELRRAGVDPGRELPDFLPTLLRLLGRLEDPEDAALLTGMLLRPALARMGESVAGSKDPWSALLRAARGWLAAAAGPGAAVRSEGVPAHA